MQVEMEWLAGRKALQQFAQHESFSVAIEHTVRHWAEGPITKPMIDTLVTTLGIDSQFGKRLQRETWNLRKAKRLGRFPGTTAQSTAQAPFAPSPSTAAPRATSVARHDGAAVVQRVDLLAEMLMCKRLGMKTSIPVLQSVLLRAEGGTLTVTRSDLEIFYQAELSLEASCADWALCVSLKTFQEVLKACCGKTVALLGIPNAAPILEVIDEDGSVATIRGLPPGDFPAMPFEKAVASATIEHARMVDAVKRVLYAVATEESRFQLAGALLELEPEENRLRWVATDGHRMALCETDATHVKNEEEDPVAVLIPGRCMRLLSHMGKAADGVELSIRIGDHHHVMERVGETVTRRLNSRHLEGTFPEYRRILLDMALSRENGAVVTAPTRELLCQSRKTHPYSANVRIGVRDDELEISATNADIGEFAAKVVGLEVEGPARNFDVGLNAYYLEDALKHCPAQVSLGFGPNGEPANNQILIEWETTQVREAVILMPVHL